MSRLRSLGKIVEMLRLEPVSPACASYFHDALRVCPRHIFTLLLLLTIPSFLIVHIPETVNVD